MNKCGTRRILSVLLLVVMVISMLPVSAYAEGSATYTQLTSADELVSGKYVMVASNGYAPGVLDSGWVTAAAVTTPDASSPVWTLTVSDDGVTLTDSKGTSIAPKGGNNNGISSGSYNWAATCTDGSFTFAGQGTDTVVLASNASSENKFRAYKTSTVSASPNGYPSTFTLYKVEGEVTPPSPPEASTKYEKVASVQEGDAVLLYNAANGKLVSSAKSGYKLSGVDATVEDNKIATDDTTVVWTVGKDGDAYTFTQGEMMLGGVVSGTYINPSTDAADGNTGWTITSANAENGSYYIASTTLSKEGYGAYHLEWYNGFTLYASAEPTEDAFGFQFFKLVEEETPEPDPEPTISTIAEALAGESGAEFTVKGVVTLVDGKNIYVQDATDAMGIYMSAAPSDIALGDTIIATGTRGSYKGLEQLSSGTYEKSEGLTLTAKETTIADLTTADVAHYITIKNLTITAISGTTLDLSDSEGNTIVTYKSVLGDTTYAVGDVIDFTGALGIFDTTLQLRNTLATEIVKVSSAPVEPEPTFNTIAEALAGESGAEFTVKGVVTLVDGKNIYVQDATGAICAYMGTKPTDISLGDTIIAKGSRTAYNGLPELGSATYEKSSGLTLSAKAATIGGLTTADICSYVKLTGLEITEIYDNNGAYSTPNITVKDEDGNSIQLYKAIINKNEDGTWEYAVGDVIDVRAAVSVYNTTLQLRNTLASEIGKSVAAENHIVTDLSELVDGAKVVIFNPANGKALSQNYSGYYNAGVDVTNTDGKLAGYGSTEIWTVGVNTDGSYTFSTADGRKFSMGASYTSTPLDDVNPNWNVLSAATADCFYIQNAARGNYLEWYASKDNWSTYTKVSDEALFAQQFYLVVKEEAQPEETGLPKAGDQVVIYNQNAEGVLAGQDDNTDSPSINGVKAQIVDGKAVPENGARIFTVEVNGDYYRFHNEMDGYLCSNGTGNNAFYSDNASEDADWKLAKRDTGYTMESRTAKYNGQYSQYLEYYADSYKTYSMYNVTDYSIYTFNFYPVTDGTNETEGIVNLPKAVFGTLADAYMGQDYTFTFTIDAVFGLDGEPQVKLGETALACTEENGTYTATIPMAQITGEKLTVTVSGQDVNGVAFSNSADIAVLDEPVFSDLTPTASSQTGEDKRPVISVKVANAGENPTVTMTINGEAVTAEYANGVVSYQSEADMEEGRTTVTVTVTRADGKQSSKSWSFTVGTARYQSYFGQLHSHTTYSDGSGTLDAALDYVRNLPDSANVDFVAFTDHSNYFDKSGAANPEGALYDMSLATEYSQGQWAAYKSAVADFNSENNGNIALGGFEMTWSGGPGHMNTFNTPGIVSRNNTTLNNKTSDAGLKAYYALLSQAEGADSISQFNHPGSTFGTFSDFAYYDALIDSRIYMVEVGNGEGQIGAGGYYPSYEYYTMALDKGWHVAPTNNQDNHKGKWGNANDARDVIITDNFTEEGIYEAIRALRMYSTEDKNLEIGYTVNDLMMGTCITEVPEKLNISVTVNDPDASDSISKVEVIVNSGKTIHTWDDPAELATGALSVELDPDYSYYYIRVTEGDGDLAVTAPVWVGESLKLGISSLDCGTSTPVTAEELTLTTTLFNSEQSNATVKSITYTTNGSVVLGTDTTGYTIPASGTLAVEFNYTPDVAKVMTITATVVVEQDGKEFTFTKDIELDVQDSESLVYVGIDASHHNEYVAGNYSDSMGNFGALAASYAVRTVELKTSEDLIAACSNPKYQMLIFTAPSRRDGSALRDPYDTYSDAEIEAIKAFNENGGAVVLCGWGDYYESYASFPAEDHMAAQQNKILTALGASLRISDDETKDDTHNGGQSQRLYLSSYNFDSFLLSGVEYDAENPHNNMYTELFSQYGGASIYTVGGTIPASVTPVVFGFDTTYSSDDDGDSYGGLGSIPKYHFDGADRLMVMATEKLDGQGLIVVSGAAFLSNFEVQATISDNGAEKNYSNYKICENLMQYVNPVTVTDIAAVRAQEETGFKYTIEGIVTSNASGYDKDTAFFDCIYVQDATGGICCFPVAGNYKIGDKVRITGTTDFYQGEPELQVSSIEVLSQDNAVTPTEVTAAQINDRSVEGKLITLKGVVESFEKANGLVQTIMVKDAEGNVARVFIDGYITTGKEVEDLAVNAEVTVTGLASYDDTFNAPEGPFPRIRVRNRADVVCGESSARIFVDVPADAYYYNAVYWAVDNDIVAGTSATTFSPDDSCTRAQAVSFLWRAAGRPESTATIAFQDVPESAYYAKAVAWAVENGITFGTSSTTFSPDEACSRAQIVSFLWRYLDSPKVSVENPFTDVEAGSYYEQAVLWAVKNKVTAGVSATSFAPDVVCNRAQCVSFLFRALAK